MISPPTVAVSGPVNVGKSAQLRIVALRLRPQARLVGPLHEHDARWVAITANGVASWWFHDLHDHGTRRRPRRSYLARHAATTPDDTRLIDRRPDLRAVH